MPGTLIRHQPFKSIYLAYFAFTFFFFRLPLHILLSLIPWTRPRTSWTARRAILVRALQDIVPVVFDTASFDVARIDPRTFSDAKIKDEVGLVWIEAKPELIVGEIKEMAERNKVGVEKVAGYWYGRRDPETGRVGQRAGADEKVMYALHGTS